MLGTKLALCRSVGPDDPHISMWSKDEVLSNESTDKTEATGASQA